MRRTLFLVGLVLQSLTDLTAQSRNKNYEVSIVTGTPGITLAGTLSLPSKKNRSPAVILIWGNGEHTRDQEISGCPMFKELSDYFVSWGIAVLRVDKRGFGKSTGPGKRSEDSTTTAELADDIEDCYKYLLGRSEIDQFNIGLLGHSEGAIIAPMVASRQSGIKWLILLGTPAVSGEEIFLKQRLDIVRRRFSTEDSVQAIYKQWQKLAALIKTDMSNDSLFYAIGYDWLKARGVPFSKKEVDNGWGELRTRWLNYFFNLNPATYLSKNRIPVLAIFGGKDRAVTVEQNLLSLKQTLDSGGNKQYKIEVLANHDHFFLFHNGQFAPRHVMGEMHLSYILLTELKEWLIIQRIVERSKQTLSK